MICTNSDCSKSASLKCSRCRTAWYCSAQCQGIDWKARHKKICRSNVAEPKPIFREKAPENIWYADKPLPEGGVIREIPVVEFMEIYQRKMGSRFIYTETLWATSQVQPEEVNPNYHSMTEIERDELSQLLRTPQIDKVAICYVNPTIGFAAYARCEIPAWSMIGIYAGEITKDTGSSNKEKVYDGYEIDMGKTVNNNQYLVSANLRGGFARFFCHLPQGKFHYSKDKDTRQLRFQVALRTGIANRRGDAEKLTKVIDGEYQQFSATLSEICESEHDLDEKKEREQRDLYYTNSVRASMRPQLLNNQNSSLAEELERKIKIFLEKEKFSRFCWIFDRLKGIGIEQCLTENVARKHFSYEGYVVPYIYTTKDIKVGDLLGFDYGPGYWASQGVLPELFDKSNRLIPRERYYYSKAQFQYDEEDKGNNYFITREQYYTALPTQQAMQTTLTSKPVSFFKVRDFLVACNVIPKSHAMVENNMFARQLQRLLQPIEGATVKCYFHNPEAPDAADQYTLDVVCSFPSLYQWANMTTFIKGNPENAALVEFCKCFARSKEVLFRSVNLETAVMRQYIFLLGQLDIKSYLNAPIDVPDVVTDGYVVGDVLA